jgi:hypothetical protein
MYGGVIDFASCTSNAIPMGELWTIESISCEFGLGAATGKPLGNFGQQMDT